MTDSTKIRAAADEAAALATGQRGAQTTQTRRVIAAAREIGIPRAAFRARTSRNNEGVYGDAYASPITASGVECVRENADDLAAAGFRVILGENFAMICTTSEERGYIQR